MSGDSVFRNCSTIGMRARTELMFQDAILSVEDMRAALGSGPTIGNGQDRQEQGTGGGEGVDELAGSRNAKAPAPGAWSEGHLAFATRGQLPNSRSGNR